MRTAMFGRSPSQAASPKPLSASLRAIQRFRSSAQWTMASSCKDDQRANDRNGSMLLKKSAPCHPLATIESPALASCIDLAPSMLVLNQYCSQVPFKILFQQHRSG